MKTKSVFLVMFAYLVLLGLGSCTEETEELAYCIRNPEECQTDEGSQEVQDGIEVDSTVVASKLPVWD